VFSIKNVNKIWITRALLEGNARRGRDQFVFTVVMDMRFNRVLFLIRHRPQLELAYRILAWKRTRSICCYITIRCYVISGQL